MSTERGRSITELFEKYGEAVHRFGLRLCDEASFAEDLVQETFLRAHRNWDQFEGRADPRTWLFTIASRTCQRLQRRRAGQPRTLQSLQALLALETDHDLNAGSTPASPLDAAVRGDEARRLHTAISALPTHFRLPLVLKELEGLSVAEVAEVLGIRAATVKTRLHRARLTLRRELAGLPAEGGGEPPSQAEGVAAAEAAAAPVSAAAAPASQAEERCADLLVAKLEAMARGVPFPVDDRRICVRCHTTLESLDRTRDLCADVPTHPLPNEIRERVSRSLRELEAG